jgi:hypothetical protein
MRVERLLVPGWDTGVAFLLPPFFAEPPGKWMLAREARLEQPENRRPFPFMLRADPFVPAARPELPAGTVSPVYLLARGLEGSLETIEASLFAPDGHEVRRAGLPVTRRLPGFEEGWTMLVALLDSEGLAPGPYELVIEIPLGSGGGATSSRIAVFITEG